VRDDVVEGAGGGREVLDRLCVQPDVRQLERIDQPRAAGDRSGRRIDAGEAGVR
jgi:hypothetical protein